VVALGTPLKNALGDKTAAALEKGLGLSTVGDLLRHYPRRYARHGELTDLAHLPLDEEVTVLAEVANVMGRPYKNRKGSILEVTVTDGRGTLKLTFFNQAWRQKQLQVGRQGFFAGKVTVFNGVRQLTHPDYELIDARPTLDVNAFTDELMPVYPATATMQSWKIVNAVKMMLDTLDPQIETLPDELRERHSLLGIGEAIRLIHRPGSLDDVRRAEHRLRFDEAFGLQLILAQRRAAMAALPATPRVAPAGGLLEAFDARLPYTLTAGQRSVGAEIAADLASEAPMNRLVQGDVGAGKTVVALRAMLQVVDSGRQAAMLAPTEVLAAQHARSLRSLLGPLAQAGELGGADQATRVTLLSGSLPAAAKKKALLEAVSGEAGIVVGTHALIQDRVEFAELGLVVVDEQHRFGVEQRDALRGRGEKAPHLLVMTATPIPRTVAMTVYGDLEVSALRELPGGRSPIATTVVPAGEKPAWLERVWSRIREEVAAGHQVYVVCPRVGGDTGKEEELPDDPDSGLDAAGAGPDERRAPLAVLDVKPKLEEGPLAGLRLGVLHGKLPPDEKDAVMRAFDAGAIDVLVATTVVEVGVDVPNSTAMVILDADRFGLSQLHQLRGRVGRGSAPGVCLLVTDVPAGTTARERLDAVASTTDGFELARMDLELRREGDVLGSLQSGSRSGLRLLSLLRHEEIIAKARGYATEIVEGDPDLHRHPGLHALVAETVGDEERAAYLDKV
jgi:ATP-dependent DNA helicase RecG